MRGRHPKPTEMHRLDGTRPHEARESEPEPCGEIGPPPPHLTPAQAELWRFHVENAPPGLLRAVDGPILAAFVVATDGVRQCAELLARDGIVAEATRPTDRPAQLPMPGLDDVPDSPPTRRPRGAVVEHPASKAMARFLAIQLRAGAELGFSPASRSRVQVGNGEEARNPFEAFAPTARASRRAN